MVSILYNMDEKKDVIFPEGFIVKKPHESAPDFIKLRMSVKVDQFTQFMNDNNNEGWINMDLKLSKKGVLYTQLNTWVAEAKKDGLPKPEVKTGDANAEYNKEAADVEWDNF